MDVKTREKINEWQYMAVPRKDALDTKLLEAYAAQTSLKIEEGVRAGEPSLFNGKVAIRHFTWEQDFLEHFKHAPLNHTTIHAAEQLLTVWPEIYEQCGTLLKSFNPLLIKGVQNDTNYNASNSHQVKGKLGAIWATVHHPVLLAQAFVHELAHTKLFALGQHFETSGPLFDNSEKDLFDSPIRLDIPRPISALFHGVYAFTHVLALDRKLYIQSSNNEEKMHLLGLLWLNALRVKKGLETVVKSAKLRPEGEHFMQAFLPWAQEEITEALKLCSGKGLIKEAAPILIVGPESEAKYALTNYLAHKCGKEQLHSASLCWNIWAMSSVVKQKKLQLFGSDELGKVLGQSGKFSNHEFLKNWIKGGVFTQQELEFMKLQLLNYLLKENPGAVFCLEESHTFLKQKDFIERLKQLLTEFGAQVIYVRPVGELEMAIKQLNTSNTEKDAARIRELLEASVFRNISAYTVDTFDEEAFEDFFQVYSTQLASGA